MTLYKLLRDFTRTFLPRLILEVFGGAGAIWGFSEAVGLRHPSTIWFWRPAALTVGGLFLIRWILQIVAFIKKVKVRDTACEEREPLYVPLGNDNSDAFEE
jgi:uncharacterized membrane protein